MRPRHFNNRWDPSLPLVRVPCPLCGNADSHPIHRENGFDVSRCASCGFVFVNPRPREEDLPAFYRKYYPPESEEAWAVLMRRIFADARDRVLTLGPRGRVLDVGCGMGHFLSLFDGSGWTAVGVDVAGRARNGLDIRSGRLEDQRFDDRSFDAVTLFYLLEHLPDPAATLRHVHRILRPGGLVLIRVPDMEPLIRLRRITGVPREFFFPPMHLCDLSPAVLRRMLREVGFDRIRTTTGGATSPPLRRERVVSLLAGALGSAVERLTGGRVLLPGVSKTTLAHKPG